MRLPLYFIEGICCVIGRPAYEFLEELSFN